MTMADVNVPLLGPVPKGGVFAGGLAVVGVAGYLWYKHMKNQQIAATAATTPPAGAGAYGYAAAYGYATAPYGYGYGPYGYGFGAYGGGGYPTPYGYGQQPISAPQNNAQWSQNVVTALTAQGYSATTVLAAVGAYLMGRPVQQGSSEDTTIQAAIALEGYPPQPGAGGYPPAINYQGGQPGQGGSVNVKASARFDNVTGSWGKISGATSYNVTLTSGQGAKTLGTASTSGTSYTFHGLPQKTNFAFHVQAEPGGQTGVAYTATR